MYDCLCCDEQFEESEGELDQSNGKFYCTDCYRGGEYKKCPQCWSIVEFLEKDGQCESCSPEDYWMDEDPDFMDSYDPDMD